ncbi:hypothetical protein MRX96_046969 [Rhipicephalus microplus]
MRAGERREQRRWLVNIRETRAQSTWTPQDIREDAFAAVVVSATTGKLLTASTVRGRTAGQAEEAAIALATGVECIQRSSNSIPKLSYRIRGASTR